MKTAWLIGLALAAALAGMTTAASAADCSGAWRVNPYYTPGTGGVCASMGLDTNRPVCQPGQRYAVYCDDASGGRYRTCQSNIPCGGRGYRDRYDRWDRYDDRRDYYNDGWRDRRHWDDGYRDRRPRMPDCTRWDFTNNRPCPPGTVNGDCYGDCGARRW